MPPRRSMRASTRSPPRRSPPGRDSIATLWIAKSACFSRRTSPPRRRACRAVRQRTVRRGDASPVARARCRLAPGSCARQSGAGAHGVRDADRDRERCRRRDDGSRAARHSRRARIAGRDPARAWCAWRQPDVCARQRAGGQRGDRHRRDCPRFSRGRNCRTIQKRRSFRRASLPPSPMSFPAGREGVHLRFLVGSALARPGLDLLADDEVRKWGVPFTKELSRQLAVGATSVLALARAPQRPLPAVAAGRAAQREVGAQIFASNAIRKLRGSVGEPSAVISAHRAADAPGGGELRLSLSSPFEPRDAEGFRCPLYPLDRVGDVASMLVDLMADCRVDRRPGRRRCARRSRSGDRRHAALQARDAARTGGGALTARLTVLFSEPWCQRTQDGRRYCCCAYGD